MQGIVPQIIEGGMIGPLIERRMGMEMEGTNIGPGFGAIIQVKMTCSPCNIGLLKGSNFNSRPSRFGNMQKFQTGRTRRLQFLQCWKVEESLKHRVGLPNPVGTGR